MESNTIEPGQVHNTKRGAGILLPVSSLPGAYGMGTLGKEARRFVRFLASAGQQYWQVLPVGPTAAGNSPYQSPSAFAGNPFLIDLEQLCDEGLIEKSEMEAVDWGKNPGRIEYGAIHEHRLPLLRSAHGRSRGEDSAEYRFFCDIQAHWLEDYALFMALKEKFRGKTWQEWDEGIKRREPKILEETRRALDAEIKFWKFTQFIFYRQWMQLKQYANRSGVRIVGDIPLYVSMDSADCWAHRELFLMDEDGKPAYVGGVPPDKFSKKGQNWNMPVYHWETHEKTGFAWWKQRMTRAGSLYDKIRIDHFIGLSRYFCIPGADVPAARGAWSTGPGEKLLRAIGQTVPLSRVIAEDLGDRNAETERLLRQFDIPSMKVLAFAFDGKENNSHLPHCYTKHCVVYGGTHDNQPLKAFFKKDGTARRLAAQYLRLSAGRDPVWETIRLGYASVADTAIFQMQDFLRLGDGARINTPGTIAPENWSWRVSPAALTPRLARRILKLTLLYGRRVNP